MVRAQVVACVAGSGLFLAALGAFAAQQGVGDRPISRGHIAPPASTTDIPCANTPFGNAVPIVSDYEAMLLQWGVGSNKFIDEYNPSTAPPGHQPLNRVYRANLVTTRTLRRAVNADLNGDGRDEVVEVLSDGADVQLAVYEREAGPTAQSISTWVFNEAVAVDSISIVAGDLDGSKSMQQEVALSWTVAGAGVDSGKVRVVVLQGNGLAHLVQASNVTAANFVTTATGLQFPRLAVGDFLAQGRKQLVLTAYDQTSGKFSLDLLEFDNGAHAASITTALPSLGNSMRGAHFTTARLDAKTTGKFEYEDSTTSDMQTSGGFPVIEALEVGGGDLVDTAADELALHLMFVDPVQAKHVLVQGIHHFVTTRDASNAITSIALNPNTFDHGPLDAAIKLGAYPDPAPKFATVVADIDAIEKKEIVTAIAGHDGNNGATTGPMVWSAHKAYVQNTPDFQWKNVGVAADGYQLVAFTDKSHGVITSYEWDFGDNSGMSPERNPLHAYTSAGTYPVKLTTTDINNVVVTTPIPNNVVVTTSTDAAPQYSGSNPPWLYVINQTPAFTGTSGTGFPQFYLYSTHPGDNTFVRLAVGDMNHDGLPELVVAVDNDGTAVDTHTFERQGDGSFGLYSLHDTSAVGVTAMEMVFSDFDGDGLHAVLSNASGACRAVSDVQVLAVTWEPPYFAVPQANSYAAATYGKTTTSGSSTEQESETTFSNSFTLGVGVDFEFEVPVLAIKTAESEAKVTLGAEFQNSTGETHSDESSYTTDISFSTGNGSGTSLQEGVVATKTNNSDCYSFTLVTSAGPVAASMMRSCQAKPGVALKEDGYGIVEWNQLGYLVPDPTVVVPVNWVPLQHDWASLALFHVPKAGSDPATPIAFPPDKDVANATDGAFTSAAESIAAVNNPYLEIDLGVVREIDSVLVFPSADSTTPTAIQPLGFKNSVPYLWGFRLYASATPFAGDEPPTTANSTTFVPDGISTFVQGTGNEAVYRYWNAWTDNPDGSGPLRARYLRLQKPGSGIIKIAEIQVFGDSHTEPQFFPEAVCDATAGDGLFLAEVYDNVQGEYRTIEVRGDINWTGVINPPAVDCTFAGECVPNCTNNNTVRQGLIWSGQSMAGFQDFDWSLASDSTKSDSTSKTSEWSVHAGAEFESKIGGDVEAVASAAYEFTGGTSTKSQTGSSTGTGFQVGGGVTGFDTYTDTGLGYAADCNYYPRPFNFTVDNYSDTGFQQRVTVTDYVVTQVAHKGDTPAAWQRDSVPALCSDNSTDDGIFAGHFQSGG